MGPPLEVKKTFIPPPIEVKYKQDPPPIEVLYFAVLGVGVCLNGIALILIDKFKFSEIKFVRIFAY